MNTFCDSAKCKIWCEQTAPILITKIYSPATPGELKFSELIRSQDKALRFLKAKHNSIYYLIDLSEVVNPTLEFWSELLRLLRILAGVSSLKLITVVHPVTHMDKAIVKQIYSAAIERIFFFESFQNALAEINVNMQDAFSN